MQHGLRHFFLGFSEVRGHVGNWLVLVVASVHRPSAPGRTNTQCYCLLVYNPTYLVIRKDDNDGAADEGEGDEVGEGDRQDGAGADDGQAGEEVSNCNQLAKEEKACTDQPEKQKDLKRKKV